MANQNFGASKLLLKKGKYSFKNTYKRPDDISNVEVIYQLKSENDKNDVPAFFITIHDPEQHNIIIPLQFKIFTNNLINKFAHKNSKDYTSIPQVTGLRG